MMAVKPEMAQDLLMLELIMLNYSTGCPHCYYMQFVHLGMMYQVLHCAEAALYQDLRMRNLAWKKNKKKKVNPHIWIMD